MSAQAGQLFPPSNLPDPTQNCPNGEVLSWVGVSGTVQCINPTPGVNVSCSTGQVLNGITNGAPSCLCLSSGQPPVNGACTTSTTTSSCPTGQTMTDVGCQTTTTTASSCPPGEQMGFNQQCCAPSTMVDGDCNVGVCPSGQVFNNGQCDCATDLGIAGNCPVSPPPPAPATGTMTEAVTTSCTVGQTYYGVMTNGVFSNCSGQSNCQNYTCTTSGLQ